MCGRFTQTKTREEVLEQLAEIELPPLFHGRYNVAPSQSVAVIRQHSPDQAEECKWGFTRPGPTSLIINARSETIREKPTFRDLVDNHRCLIPADGFYEWKGKQPFYFQIEQNEIFGFAGLWRNGQCVILTRAADQNMQGIHDRMPLIMQKEHWKEWLLQSHSLPPHPPTLHCRPVSMKVNNVINNDPSCLAPGEVQGDLSLFPDEE
jgi:putative SOS response-associated peptidase YedK